MLSSSRGSAENFVVTKNNEVIIEARIMAVKSPKKGKLEKILPVRIPVGMSIHLLIEDIDFGNIAPFQIFDSDNNLILSSIGIVQDSMLPILEAQSLPAGSYSIIISINEESYEASFTIE